MADEVSLNELYTLKEVYEIEFGVRGFWKCIFENSPPIYHKKAMIAKECTESDFSTAFSAHKIGLIDIYTPDALMMPELQITFYDDNKSTIENWLRDWKNKMKKGTEGVTYIDSYADYLESFQYNQQYELISVRKYLVAPVGKITVTNGDTVNPTNIVQAFKVFDFEVIK